uniref:Uncharacterized protein n=1 Tax=Arion vulgaris TaxID=1028688 RepID=A0A0B7A3U1_9EUPU
MFSTEYPSRYIKIHSIILNLTGYEEMIDIPKKRFAVEVTPVDITVIAVASCLCLILLIAGGFVFAREMYHKKMSKRFTSTRVALRTETVALTSIPAHSIAYGDVDMNEEHCVNPGYTHSLQDDDSSVTAEHKTTFPSSEQSAPGVNVSDKTSIKHKDYKSTHVTKASSTSTPSQRHGTNKDESPGYGLVIGLMGYTKRLERQQQLNQQQKQQFEENSYYAVPHKRAKTGKLQDFPDTAIPQRSSQLTSSHSPPESTIVEDSFISSPRHLRTLPTTNGVSDSNEELLSPGSRTKRGVDNPYVSEHTGKADEAQVFHF